MATAQQQSDATRQQTAAVVLAAILELRELTPATWYLYPDRMSTGPRLVAQLSASGTIGDVRAAIQRYADEFGLAMQDDVPCGSGRDAFIKIEAAGVFRGVQLSVWGPADRGGARQREQLAAVDDRAAAEQVPPYTLGQLIGDDCARCGQPLAEGQPTAEDGQYDHEPLRSHLACIEAAESGVDL